MLHLLRASPLVVLEKRHEGTAVMLMSDLSGPSGWSLEQWPVLAGSHSLSVR